MFSAVDTLAVNTIRCLAADVVQGPNSGHPGAPIGLAPTAYVLFRDFLRFDPSDPAWPARDRFVLSNGHASALLYVLQHLYGGEMTMDDLKAFRKLGSRTPGHPENSQDPRHHNGIEITTGMLGQGIASAVGMAIAQKMTSAKLPGLFSDRVFCICGDGCLQEGVSGEACSLAGTLKLDNLVLIHDDNHITIDGPTDLSFTEDVAARYRAYGWTVIRVENGDTDLAAIREALSQAVSSLAEEHRPVLVQVRTTIGLGSPKQNTAGCHGSPLGPEGVKALKEHFGMPQDKTYHVPEEAAAHFASQVAAKRGTAAAWFAALSPEQREKVSYRFAVGGSGENLRSLAFPNLIERTRSAFEKLKADNAGKSLATRKASQLVLNLLASELIGDFMVSGSADLAPSCLTTVSQFSDFAAGSADPNAQYIHYGIREHAMCAISNGIAAYGGFVPFDSTFLIFFNYCAAAIRNGAISHLGCVHIFTHDSIMLGEDGRTHQPIETLAWLRSMPHVVDWRPAGLAETLGCYLCAISGDRGVRGTPFNQLQHVLCLSRQGVEELPRTSAGRVSEGAYVFYDSSIERMHSGPARGPGADPEEPSTSFTLIGSGAEVAICYRAALVLQERHTDVAFRVVSMPSFTVFDARPKADKVWVIPALEEEGCPCLAVEPYVDFGMKGRYAHRCVSIETFGESGPAKDLAEHFGMTVDNVVAEAEKMLSANKESPAPKLGWGME